MLAKHAEIHPTSKLRECYALPEFFVWREGKGLKGRKGHKGRKYLLGGYFVAESRESSAAVWGVQRSLRSLQSIKSLTSE